MIEHFLVVVEVRPNQCQEQHDKRNQADEDIEGNPRRQEKAIVLIEFLEACQRRPKSLRTLLSPVNLIE